ncbi:MAG: hypothetical protein HGB11_14250, partial [Chlorobiales bacterium]|nr:hypothetical protein [Chlorobiales bacterium]
MKDYSPSREGADLTALAKMLEETWQLVDSESPEINFSQYDCFMVFHAGIGRDVNLVSITGVDLTPYDLPSITFNLSQLKTAFGDSFQGFPVDGGSVLISNTVVLPQTESREVDAIGGKALLEISSNGLAVASFASFLGLPDLFNTENGRSGIGRFGLADGEGIFNYNGILPPEPSAWERIYLGWAKAVEVSGVDEVLRLPAQGLHLNADSVIYKVPITSREYLLIENRQRDAKAQGVTLTRYLNGSTSQLSFTSDTEQFSYFNTEALDGNIVACTNYDWTIPAGKVSANNGPTQQVDGGVLIWHIDEDIIAANLAANKINTVDPKGVYLLEADGAQDIGQNYGITSAANGAQSGTPLDYFFNSNPSVLYKNLIDASTYPSTRSNSKAESNITIQDFSAQAQKMTARVKRKSNLVEMLAGFPFQINDAFDRHSGISALKAASGNGYSLFLNSATSRAYTRNFGTSVPNSLITEGALVASEKMSVSTLGTVGVRDSTVYFFYSTNLASRNVGSLITTAPVVDTVSKTVSVGTKSGKVVRLSLTGTTLDILSSSVISTQPIISLAGSLVIAADKAVLGSITWNFSGLKVNAAVATGKASGWVGAVVAEPSTVLLLYADGSIKTVQVSVADSISSQPVAAEIEHRGGLVLLVSAGNKLYA